jgi:hypothetical protein
MTKTRLPLLLALLAGMIVVFGGLPLLKGGFYLGKHEGDTLHLAELVLRMADGQWPHLDFMTPIGVLAIAPIAWFVKAGAGMGHAIFYAQILVALIMFPAVVRVAVSRLTGLWPYLYGAFVMVLCLALVHGEAERSVSISMHYNRWAWAVSYIILPLAVLSPLGRPRPWLDGAIIGVGLALLVLTKVTYFAAFAPGILIALLARRDWRAIAAAAAGGLVVAAAMTWAAGFGFWLAYLNDLRTVAGGDVRAAPGDPLTVVISAPMYMGASLALVAAVIFLRQAGRSVEGLALLVVMPGFFYVAYQNFGNDPQWLPLLAMFVFLLRPEDPEAVNGFGWNLRNGLTVVGILALAFGLPSVINLTYSPFRHMAAPTEDQVALLPGRAEVADMFTTEARLYRVDVTEADDLEGGPFASYRKRGKREDGAVLNGETLRDCELAGGMNSWFEVVSKDLEGAGYAGKRLMGTDLFSLYWAFGDFETVKGAAPWYYGGLSGVENADYLVVPVCPMARSIRAEMLKDLTKGGWTLTEVRRTELYILVEAKAPAAAATP